MTANNIIEAFENTEEEIDVEDLIKNHEISLVKVATNVAQSRINLISRLVTTATKFRMVTGVDYILEMVIAKDAEWSPQKLFEANRISDAVSKKIVKFIDAIKETSDFETIGSIAERYFITKNYKATGLYDHVYRLALLEIMQHVGEVCDHVTESLKISEEELDKELTTIIENKFDYLIGDDTQGKLDDINLNTEKTIEDLIKQLKELDD